ncbi:VOC family protein [Falsiroseomonas selenitidurans]|uniref:VOC family protein n=1 Tax=Falsiroseomonas selenitidurans TaxID=2716335 RepID=A0ABX1EAP9_9PROT|nr:VOC family protein [Falsiroseomonas selenitidurans]NKC33915.1 VOC family protein [Falsiroseomonas selenitidurans]
MSVATTLDHVGLCTADLPGLIAAWERMGFCLSPRARQSGHRTPDGPVEPYGTENRCAFLRHGYVELLGLVDPALFANGLDGFLARYTGAHIIAFGIQETEGNLARLRAGGLPIPGVSWLQRPVEAGGPIARFARLPFPDAPEGRLQLIQHLTPELVWDPRWMAHTNGAEALETTILAVASPAETGARLSRLTGQPLRPDPLGGFVLTLPGAAGGAGPFSPALATHLRILPEAVLGQVLPGVTAPTLPFIAGMVIRTGDQGRAARAVLEGLPTRPAPDGLMVPPEAAGGAAVVFA